MVVCHDSPRKQIHPASIQLALLFTLPFSLCLTVWLTLRKKACCQVDRNGDKVSF